MKLTRLVYFSKSSFTKHLRNFNNNEFFIVDNLQKIKSLKNTNLHNLYIVKVKKNVNNK